MKRSLVVLTGAQVAVAAVVLAAGRRPLPTAREWALMGFAALAFAGASHVAVHLELRRHAFTVTPAEAVVAIGLFLLPPLGLALAVTTGSILVCVFHRLPPIKVVYNAAQAANASALAAWVFLRLGRPTPQANDAAVIVFAAAAAYFAVNVTSVCAAIAVSEDRGFVALLRATAGPALVATAGSSALGALIAVLSPHGWAMAVAVPVVGLLMVSTRSVAVHRAERLRFERLYAASFRTGRLRGVEDALVTLAGEAKALVTGTAALCAVGDRQGNWSGVIVADKGYRVRAATPAEIMAARALVERRHPTEHAITCPRHQVPILLQTVADDGAATVAAVSPEEGADQVVMVVFRTLDEADERSHANVLAVFCRHASLTISNARLYQEAEEALQRQVDLNRQKDDFLAAVSHELKTPLTSMLGSVDTIARLGERMAVEKRAQFCAMAKSQGLRLKRLIEELLLVAAADAGSMGCTITCIDVEQLMNALAVEFSPICGDRLQVAVRGDQPLFSDGDKIRRVLVNLTENAAKYAPEGPIEVTATRTDRGWTFEVVDHGVGIQEGDRERVFGRFVQLDQSSTRRQGGTGLGLYLCRELAEALGGSVSVTGNDHGGCRFVLDVPNLVSDDEAARYLALESGGRQDDELPTPTGVGGG